TASMAAMILREVINDSCHCVGKVDAMGERLGAFARYNRLKALPVVSRRKWRAAAGSAAVLVPSSCDFPPSLNRFKAWEVARGPWVDRGRPPSSHRPSPSPPYKSLSPPFPRGGRLSPRFHR